VIVHLLQENMLMRERNCVVSLSVFYACLIAQERERGCSNEQLQVWKYFIPLISVLMESSDAVLSVRTALTFRRK
jgi:hypothetical protein